MASLFNRIDQSIINVFQWAIRQIELHTPLTRKYLGEVLTVTFNMIICSHFVIFFVIILLNHKKNTISIITLMVLSTMTLNTYISKRDLKNHLKKTENVGNTLPEERITRIFHRYTIILIVQAMIFFEVIIPILFPKDIIATVYFLLLCAVPVYTVFISEYYMCTTSLPPGEKAKIRAEKEMKNATPSFG